MDIMPEIMDGKNVADFIDPDIVEKLEALEREEERLQAEGFYDSDSDIVRAPPHSSQTCPHRLNCVTVQLRRRTGSQGRQGRLDPQDQIAEHQKVQEEPVSPPAYRRAAHTHRIDVRADQSRAGPQPDPGARGDAGQAAGCRVQAEEG